MTNTYDYCTYYYLLYLRNKNYWKIIIEKKRKEKNSNYIDHKNISEVLYISLLFYISKRC